jgi:monoamine oxidase
VMRRLDAKRTPDRSFEDFLATKPGGRTQAHNRQLALQYVQGFHAADPARISERALGANGSPDGDVREQRMGRVVDGYDRVINWIAQPLAARIRLSAVATRVEWARGDVRVKISHADGRPRGSVAARAAIVTLPIGVLKAPPGERGAIAFEPELRETRAAIDRIASGAVVRIVLRFRHRFWASDAFADRTGIETLDTLSFLHTSDPDIPVWWTSYPLRTPVMVGWCGGPRAEALARLGPDAIEARAIASLARQLGVTIGRLRRELAGVFTHDWQHDPFARGAYSYQMVDGAEAPKALARPVDQTLFFAGEAADAEGSTGTVHGAISSGRRAASQVIRAVGGKSR